MWNEISFVYSDGKWPFLIDRLVKAWCREIGGKWMGNPVCKDNPATACRLWSNAAECSWAFLLNSATEVVLASVPKVLQIVVSSELLVACAKFCSNSNDEQEFAVL